MDHRLDHGNRGQWAVLITRRTRREWDKVVLTGPGPGSDINWDRIGASYKMPNFRKLITISRLMDRLEKPTYADAFLDLFSRSYVIIGINRARGTKEVRSHGGGGSVRKKEPYEIFT